MKEYMKPEMKLVEFETEVITVDDLTRGVGDVSGKGSTDI